MKKSLILLVAMVFALFSCKQAEKPADEIQTLTLEQVLSDNFEYKGGQVELEGLVLHVCAHSGKKMFIGNPDNPEQKIQIFTSDNISSFPKDLEGVKVSVVGTLEEEKLDMEYANKLEEEIKAEEKESSDHSCEFEESMKKVENLKQRIQNSPKGYISKYTMKATSFKKL